MVKLGVMGKITITIGDTKYHSYAFNPIYINTQKFITSDIYFLFKPYLDKEFPYWAKQAYEELQEDENEASGMRPNLED